MADRDAEPGWHAISGDNLGWHAISGEWVCVHNILSDEPCDSCKRIMGENDKRLAEREKSEQTRLGWHVIEGQRLLDLLRRCQNGENADLVFAEEWANARHEHVEGDEA